MATAIVLSGGGSKGDFEVGALRYIYDRGIRPDIVCGTSVGAINAAKLAEGEDAGNLEQGFAGLESIWMALQQNSDMYAEEAWLYHPDMDPRVRDWLTGRAADLRIHAPDGLLPAWGELGKIIGLIGQASFLVSDGRALLQSLALITKARSLYHLEPIKAKLDTLLDTEKIAAWAAGGRKLRLAMVGLESGRLRWVTETGDVIEGDGRPVLDRSRISALCQPLARNVEEMEREISDLQAELQTAPPTMKGALASAVGKRKAALGTAQAQLEACLENNPADPLRVNIRSGVLASASVPGIFPPISLGGDTYVDGGVRAVLPLQVAIDLGAATVYAVSTSPLDVEKSKVSYQRATLDGIVSRSVMELLVNEVARDDARVHPASPGGVLPAIFHIRPDFEIHDMTTVDPGLIQISRDYGYMRAADTLDAIDPGSRRWAVATTIATHRKQTWGHGEPLGWPTRSDSARRSDSNCESGSSALYRSGKVGAPEAAR